MFREVLPTYKPINPAHSALQNHHTTLGLPSPCLTSSTLQDAATRPSSAHLSAVQGTGRQPPQLDSRNCVSDFTILFKQQRDSKACQTEETGKKKRLVQNSENLRKTRSLAYLHQRIPPSPDLVISTSLLTSKQSQMTPILSQYPHTS